MVMNSHDHDIDGNIRKFTIDQFELVLTTLRRTRNYNGAVYEIFERYHEEETSKAIMIHLVMTTPLLNPADKDLVLMTWGLLPGFTDIESIGERRRQYIRASGYNKSDDKLPRIERNNLTTEQLDKLAENLMKKENPAYEKIAKQHHDIALDPHNTEQFILSARQEWLDVHGYAKLPKASFLSDYSTIDNLSLRNLHFVAREDILADIYQKYYNTDNPVQVQALCGMAGVGKSTIALEYAYRYRAIYGLIWWIDASSETTLVNSCTKFLERKGINYEQTNGPTVIINLFLDIIAEEPEHLLIFDNADMFFDNPSTFDDLLGYIRLPKSHILITTRIASDCDWSVIHHVKPFDLKSSIKYLVDKSGKPEDEYTQVLAERLDNLPLALTYAGAYIKHHTDYNGYLDLWNRESLKLWDDEDGNYADRTVRQAFNITLDKIIQRAPSIDYEILDNLLLLCAFFELGYLPFDAYVEHLKDCIGIEPKPSSKPSYISFRTIVAYDPIDHEYHGMYLQTRQDGTMEERWSDGPSKGELVPPDCARKSVDYLSEALLSDVDRNKLIRRITMYSLVDYHDGNLYMHPLLKEIIRDEFFTSDQYQKYSRGSVYAISNMLEIIGENEMSLKYLRKYCMRELEEMKVDIARVPIIVNSDNEGFLQLDFFHHCDLVLSDLLRLGDISLLKDYLSIHYLAYERTIRHDDTYPCALQLMFILDKYYQDLSERLGRRIIYQCCNSPEVFRETGEKRSMKMTRTPKTNVPSTPNDPALALVGFVINDPETAFVQLAYILTFSENETWHSIALPPEFNNEELFKEAFESFEEDNLTFRAKVNNQKMNDPPDHEE